MFINDFMYRVQGKSPVLQKTHAFCAIFKISHRCATIFPAVLVAQCLEPYSIPCVHMRRIHRLGDTPLFQFQRDTYRSIPPVSATAYIGLGKAFIRLPVSGLQSLQGGLDRFACKTFLPEFLPDFESRMLAPGEHSDSHLSGIGFSQWRKLPASGFFHQRFFV